MIDVKKSSHKIGARLGEQIIFWGIMIVLAAWFMWATTWVVGSLERGFEFKHWQDQCWAEEAQTGNDLDCQDDDEPR